MWVDPRLAKIRVCAKNPGSEEPRLADADLDKSGKNHDNVCSNSAIP